MHIYGNSIAEDNVFALALLQRAAMQGHVEAAYNLGICHHYGYGTDAGLKTAFQMHMKSAEAGYGKDMVPAGRFYNQGIFDCSDRKKAECLLKKPWRAMILKLLTRRASNGITGVTLKKPMVR